MTIPFAWNPPPRVRRRFLLAASILSNPPFRPMPEPPTLPDLFRQWWRESYPTTPPNPRTVETHVAFAEWVLSQQQQEATDAEK